MPVTATARSTPNRSRAPLGHLAHGLLADRAVRVERRLRDAELADLLVVRVDDRAADERAPSCPGIRVSSSPIMPPVHDSAVAIVRFRSRSAARHVARRGSRRRCRRGSRRAARARSRRSPSSRASAAARSRIAHDELDERLGELHLVVDGRAGDAVDEPAARLRDLRLAAPEHAVDAPRDPLDVAAASRSVAEPRVAGGHRRSRAARAARRAGRSPARRATATSKHGARPAGLPWTRAPAGHPDLAELDRRDLDAARGEPRLHALAVRARR